MPSLARTVGLRETGDSAVCAEVTCSDGLKRCDGCNGWGVVTMGGRRYKLRSGARTIAASSTKQDHAECGGTGLAVCGCTPVDSAAVELLSA